MSTPAPDFSPPLAEPSVFVRPSREADVPAMLAIYLHHIRNGVDPNYDGESDAPDADDLKRRRSALRSASSATPATASITTQRGRSPHCRRSSSSTSAISSSARRSSSASPKPCARCARR